MLCAQGSLRFTPDWHRSGFQPFWERGSIKNADISARILCFVNYKFYYSAFPFFFIQKYMPQYAMVTPKVMPRTTGNRCFRSEKVIGISRAANRMK